MGRTLRELQEDELVLLQASLLRHIGLVLVGLRESLRQLKDSLTRAGEGVTLLSEEDV